MQRHIPWRVARSETYVARKPGTTIGTRQRHPSWGVVRSETYVDRKPGTTLGTRHRHKSLCVLRSETYRDTHQHRWNGKHGVCGICVFIKSTSNGSLTLYVCLCFCIWTIPCEIHCISPTTKWENKRWCLCSTPNFDGGEYVVAWKTSCLRMDLNGGGWTACVLVALLRVQYFLMFAGVVVGLHCLVNAPGKPQNVCWSEFGNYENNSGNYENTSTGL